jgi:hypothetical protein
VRPDAADIVRQPAHRGGCRRGGTATPRLPAAPAAPGGRRGDRGWSRTRPLSPRLGAHRPTGTDTGHPRAGFLVVSGRAGDRLAYVARSCLTPRRSGLWTHTRARHRSRRGTSGSGLDEIAAPYRDRVVSDLTRPCGAGTQGRWGGGRPHWPNHHCLSHRGGLRCHRAVDAVFFYFGSGCRFNARAACRVRRLGCDCCSAVDPGRPFDAPGRGAGSAAGCDRGNPRSYVRGVADRIRGNG